MSVSSPTEATRGATGAAAGAPAPAARSFALGDTGLAALLLAPAMLCVLLFFVYPLGHAVVGAFAIPGAGDAPPGWGLGHFARAVDLYGTDIVFTGLLVSGSVLLTGALAVAIAGYLTLGETPWAVATLRWLYRWPLFIPFIVAAQMMRSFLAKNGLMNNTLVGLGMLEPIQTIGFLDWRGVVATFVWKQLPFVTLLVAGAMAALDRSTIEAARNLGAGRLRILLEIVLPQVKRTLAVALVLSFVTMMSVLSVPVMINAGSPTLITVDMAYRINAHGDYGVANALGIISYLMTGLVAWIYLKHGIRQHGGQPR